MKPWSADLKAPFSDGVMVGNTLYIAGHIGLDAKTGLPPASADQEARLVMDGIKQTVESAGLTMDDVVSVQTFCTDLKHYDTFKAIYRTYFHGDYRSGHSWEPTNCCVARDVSNGHRREASAIKAVSLVSPIADSLFIRPDRDFMINV